MIVSSARVVAFVYTEYKVDASATKVCDSWRSMLAIKLLLLLLLLVSMRKGSIHGSESDMLELAVTPRNRSLEIGSEREREREKRESEKDGIQGCGCGLEWHHTLAIFLGSLVSSSCCSNQNSAVCGRVSLKITYSRARGNSLHR